MIYFVDSPWRCSWRCSSWDRGSLAVHCRFEPFVILSKWKSHLAAWCSSRYVYHICVSWIGVTQNHPSFCFLSSSCFTTMGGTPRKMGNMGGETPSSYQNITPRVFWAVWARSWYPIMISQHNPRISMVIPHDNLPMCILDAAMRIRWSQGDFPPSSAEGSNPDAIVSLQRFAKKGPWIAGLCLCVCVYIMCIYIYICVHVHTCTWRCVDVYIYIYVYIYICIYIYHRSWHGDGSKMMQSMDEQIMPTAGALKGPQPDVPIAWHFEIWGWFRIYIIFGMVQKTCITKRMVETLQIPWDV